MNSIPNLPAVKFEYEAALFFLSGGHYLFRTGDGKKVKSKFLTAADVAAAFSGQEQDTGWMPAGVLRVGHNDKGPWYVYSAPAQRVRTVIELTGQEPRPVYIPIPRTVMLIREDKNDIRIWSLTGTHFDPQEKPLHAPFPNVYNDGRICWGSARLPKVTPENARKVWQLFFDATFNAHLSSNKSKAQPANICHQLIALDGKRTYPLDDLEPAGSTSISRVIDDLLKGKS